MNAVLWQRIEGALVFAAALAAIFNPALSGATQPWWLYVLVFFAPDLGFLGYLAGPRVGAAVYNLLHLYGMGLVLAVLGGVIVGTDVCLSLGFLWMGHVGFDRMLGYGLKLPSAFADTHLGRIGK